MVLTSRLLGSVAAVAAAAACAAPAAAQSNAELLQRIEQLQQRVDELEGRQARQEETAERQQGILDQEVVRQTGDGFVIPGTDTTLQIGGYVKADAIYDLDEDLGDLFVQDNITTDDDGDEAAFGAHSRQSRLFIKTSTPTETFGDIKTHLEADFFGGGGNEAFSNSFRFRLRHAYADIGNFRAGQNWTLFMPIEVYPTTLDFQGPVGIPFIRQTQLRYTQPLGEGFAVALSLENSEFSGRDADGDDIGESTGNPTLADPQLSVDQFPDLVAAGTLRRDWGFAKIAGVARQLNVPDADEAFAWGLNGAGAVNLWDGGALTGSLTYGDGVGRYIINGFGRDGFLENDDELQTVSALGAVGGIEQAITDKLTGRAYYGYYGVDETLLPSDLETLQSVHGNLTYALTERALIGGEISWGMREDADGDSDDNIRLQTSVQVNF